MVLPGSDVVGVEVPKMSQTRELWEPERFHVLRLILAASVRGPRVLLMLRRAALWAGETGPGPSSCVMWCHLVTHSHLGRTGPVEPLNTARSAAQKERTSAGFSHLIQGSLSSSWLQLTVTFVFTVGYLKTVLMFWTFFLRTI